jgi:hypothetical protein
MRAIEVLERIGSVAARKVLQRVAAGAALAPETDAATSALQRLARAANDRKKRP